MTSLSSLSVLLPYNFIDTSKSMSCTSLRNFIVSLCLNIKGFEEFFIVKLYQQLGVRVIFLIIHAFLRLKFYIESGLGSKTWG